VTQLCIFAEFRNINLWFRAPAQYGHDREAEHAAWLVRETKGQVQDTGADTVDKD
jgi:hypothetical protein